MNDIASTEISLRILVIDDELEIRRTLAMCLEMVGHRVVTATNIREALQELSKSAFDLVFLDIRLGEDNGLDFLPNILGLGVGAKVVVITGYATVTTAVEAMKLGASDFLTKPFTPTQINLLTKKIAEHRETELKRRALQDVLGDGSPEADLSTTSIDMTAALQRAREIAATSSPVVICGEAGVGKSVLARLIHEWSSRADRPFVTATSRGESAVRVETELFGRSREQSGRIKAAEGGTLVVDDLTELGLPIQAKLLQLTQTGAFERSPGEPPQRADVRLIAITPADPTYAVSAGKLSQEFFYTLDACRITIPPLRARPEDVSMLAERYLSFFSKQHRRTITGFTPEAIDALRQYAWPGNIRELRNIVERAYIACKAEQIGVSDLPIDQLSKLQRVTIGDAVALDVIEEMHIRRVLESTESFDQAATILKINPATLWRKRKRYGC